MSECHPNPRQVMELPEVLSNIGYFLGRDSLVSSVRVCTLWQQILEPLLYRTIGHSKPLPSAEALQRHLGNIRTLLLKRSSTYEKGDKWDQLYLCSNLRTLSIIVPSRIVLKWPIHLEIPELDMIEANRKLLKLQIEDDKSSVSRCCWDRILSNVSPVLQELSLTNVNMSIDATGHLLEIAQSLVELKLVHCRIAPLDVKATPPFTNLRSLFISDVFASPVRELEWISHCPRLKTLNWTPHWQEGARNFFQEIKSQRWPQLTHLDMNSGSRGFRDTEVAAMLEACDNLHYISVSGSAFWYRSLKSLRRHLHTLDELDLSGCTKVQGWMCHWILTQSPKLRSFYCEYIEAHELIADCPLAKVAIYTQAFEEQMAQKDGRDEEVETLLEPRHQELLEELRSITEEFEDIRLCVHTQPWACLELEDFLCSIIIQSPKFWKKQWDPQILRRLSLLKKLKRLDLSVIEDTTSTQFLESLPDWRGVGLDLKSGLAQLETLDNLQIFLFQGTQQNLGMEDCQWMMDHWPALKKISGDFHPDDDVCKQLRDMMVRYEVSNYYI